MRRHHIRNGDLTTAGGVVFSGTLGFNLLDRAIVLEGDAIACPGCHSTGTIVCIGPRIPAYFHGQQIALEGDLCACKCPTPPKLIPSQIMSFQEVEGSYDAQGINKLQTIASQTNASKEAKWIKFHLNEAGSCEGLSCVVYFDDGSKMNGEFDADNKVAFYNVSGNHVERVEFTPTNRESSSSITEMLLDKLGV